MSDEKKPGSPFAKLAALRAGLPAGPAPLPDAAAVAPVDRRFGGKIVVTRTKRGRGGKTVTVITGIAGSGGALDETARTMQRALGCGGGVEDGAVVLQGDQIDRAIEWLESQGAARVVRGV